MTADGKPIPGKYLIACGKPASHREVAPREFDVHSRWKPEREARREEKQKKKKEKKKKGDEGRAAKRKQLVQQVRTVTAY